MKKAEKPERLQVSAFLRKKTPETKKTTSPIHFSSASNYFVVRKDLKHKGLKK